MIIPTLLYSGEVDSFTKILRNQLRNSLALSRCKRWPKANKGSTPISSSRCMPGGPKVKKIQIWWFCAVSFVAAGILAGILDVKL